MSNLFLFARSFPFGEFHPLEYVQRLSKEYDQVKQYRSVILSPWLFSWLSYDPGADRPLSRSVPDVAIVNL